MKPCLLHIKLKTESVFSRSLAVFIFVMETLNAFIRFKNKLPVFQMGRGGDECSFGLEDRVEESPQWERAADIQIINPSLKSLFFLAFLMTVRLLLIQTDLGPQCDANVPFKQRAALQKDLSAPSYTSLLEDAQIKQKRLY